MSNGATANQLGGLIWIFSIVTVALVANWKFFQSRSVKKNAGGTQEKKSKEEKNSATTINETGAEKMSKRRAKKKPKKKKNGTASIVEEMNMNKALERNKAKNGFDKRHITNEKNEQKCKPSSQKTVLRSSETSWKEPISFSPIGYVSSIYRLCVGTPRQGLLAPSARGILRFDSFRINPDCLQSLEEFSHVWVLFAFHLNTNSNAVLKAQGSGSYRFPSKVCPPALGGKTVGLFATRTPHRPNPVGISLCQIEKVDSSAGFCVYVSAIDLV